MENETRKSKKAAAATRLATIVAMVVMIISFSLLAQAQPNSTGGPCRPLGATRGCSANGKPGQQICDGGVWTVCRPSPPPPPPPVTGDVRPKYLVMTVIYAPPGSKGGNSSSSVTYGSSSTLGSSVSSSDSFKVSDNVSVTASNGFFDAEVGVNFGYTNSSSNTHTTDIKKTNSSEITLGGPPANGINHDDDQIWLLRRPVVEVKIYPTASDSKSVSKVTWRLADSQQNPPMYVYVKWLKHPEQLSREAPGVLKDLRAAGITPEDFPEILKADPFANVSSGSLDPNSFPNRFQLVASLPYEPPAEAGGSVPVQKYTISQTNTQTDSSSAEEETTVGVTLQADAIFLDLFKVAIKNQTNWTWTSTATTSSSTGTTESASLALGGPAFGYQGPIDIAVYYDVLFKTFLFAFLPDTAMMFQGVVTNRAGQPVSGKEVSVIANGIRYSAFTNAKGQYHIFRRFSGPVRIQVAGVVKELPQIPTNRKVDIALTR